MAASDELAKLDATAQAQLVRSGEISPLELVEAAIARIEARNGELNAFIHPLFDKARAQAASDDLPDGPFRGVPFAVKDAVCHTAGDPYHVGNVALKEAGWTETEDTELARRYRAAGFVFVGKTNTPEFAASATTEPRAYGPTRNPWALDHSTGGSSGGTAAAVAAGLVPIGHGNDMAGSIRIPSSACGLVGLKPSRARNSLAPDFGEYWGPLTHEHVLTRSVRDSAAVLDATAGPAPGDPYFAPPPARPWREEVGADPGRLRVGFRSRAPGAVITESTCVEGVERSAKLLESLGHHVEEVELPALDAPALAAGSGTLVMVSCARELDRWSERLGRTLAPEECEPMTAFMAERGRAISATQYQKIIEDMQRAARGVCEWWQEGYDLLVTPTLACVPPKIGVVGPDGAMSNAIAGLAALASFTAPFNLTGQPAISLPLHHSDEGLPVGVQLVAPYAREDLLFRIASQLEAAAPWEGLPR